MDRSITTGRRALHTIGALLLAFIIYTVVAVVAEMILFWLNEGTSILPSGVIAFVAALMGAAIGIVVANAACERWTPHFNGRVVFSLFALLCLAGLLSQALFKPLEAAQLKVYGQILMTAYCAYQAFWKSAWATN